MGIRSEYEELFYKNSDQFSYHVKIFLLDDIANEKYFVQNPSIVTDSTGYRPGYLIHPDIDKWLRKSVGAGQRGMALPGETNYINRLPDQKWWHGWSFDGKHHYIYIHFTKKSDALAFKMVWG